MQEVVERCSRKNLIHTETQTDTQSHVWRWLHHLKHAEFNFKLILNFNSHPSIAGPKNLDYQNTINIDPTATITT